MGQQDVRVDGGGIARDVDDGIGDHVAGAVDGGRVRDQRVEVGHQVAGGVEHRVGRERVRPTFGVAVVDRVVVPVEQLQDLVAILGDRGHGISSSSEGVMRVWARESRGRYGAINSGVAVSTPPSTGSVTPGDPTGLVAGEEHGGGGDDHPDPAEVLDTGVGRVDVPAL